MDNFDDKLNLDTFEKFNDIKTFDDNDFIDNNTRIFFLDSNNNYVDINVAVKCVVRVYNDENNLIDEIWYYFSNKKSLDVNIKLDVLFEDEFGNKVSKDKACKIIFRKIDGLNIISEDVYTISKNDVLSL